MSSINLLELVPRCHEAAKAKGFWDVQPHPAQMLMLTIGELGEAQEADRKGRATDPNLLLGIVSTLENCPEYFETRFAGNIKDTVGDELADTYIRLCDYAGGFHIDLTSRVGPERDYVLETYVQHVPENLGAAMLPIVQDILNINCGSKLNSEAAMSAALLKLELLCKARGIDLATHIDLKLRFNATRPAKHGKAY